MAKTQTRRSLSCKGTIYLRLRRYLGGLDDGPSMSAFVEDLIEAKLDELNAPAVSHDEIVRYARREAEARAAESRRRASTTPPANFDDPTGIFTF